MEGRGGGGDGMEMREMEGGGNGREDGWKGRESEGRGR